MESPLVVAIRFVAFSSPLPADTFSQTEPSSLNNYTMRFTQLLRQQRAQISGTHTVHSIACGFFERRPVELNGGWCRPLGIERGADRPCVLLVHGLGHGAAASMEHPLLQHLCVVASLCGLATFRFDQRGRGRSALAAPVGNFAVDAADTAHCIGEVLSFYESAVMVGVGRGAALVAAALHASDVETRRRVLGFAAVSPPLTFFDPKDDIPAEKDAAQQPAPSARRAVAFDPDAAASLSRFPGMLAQWHWAAAAAPPPASPTRAPAPPAPSPATLRALSSSVPRPRSLSSAGAPAVGVRAPWRFHLAFVQGEREATPDAAAFYSALGRMPLVVPGASGEWASPADLRAMSDTMGPWLAAVCGTQFQRTVSLMGFRR